MRILIWIAFVFLSLNHAISQDKGVVVSKVTATWCPNCGNWGWDYFEALRNIYANNPDVCLLGVHHSGDLLNPTSNWFSGNLNNSYQPEFYINNEQMDVLSFNWNDKVAELQDRVTQYQNETAFANFNFINAFTEGGEIVCNFNFAPTSKSNGDYYFAVYVFENMVPNFQSSRGMEMHPNVLRDVIADNYFGELYASSGQSVNSRQLELRKNIDPNWDEDNLGLVAVMWRESNGSYILDNARSIYNISLLSSQDEVDEDMLTIQYLPNGVNLKTEMTEELYFQFFSPNGSLLESSPFVSDYFLNTSQYPAGIYLLSLKSGQRVVTKQIAVF